MHRRASETNDEVEAIVLEDVDSPQRVAGGGGSNGKRRLSVALTTVQSAVRVSETVASNPFLPSGTRYQGINGAPGHAAVSSSLTASMASPGLDPLRRGSRQSAFEEDRRHSSASKLSSDEHPGTSVQSSFRKAHTAQKTMLQEMFDNADHKRRGCLSVGTTMRVLSKFGVALDETDMEELLREVMPLELAAALRSHDGSAVGAELERSTAALLNTLRQSSLPLEGENHRRPSTERDGRATDSNSDESEDEAAGLTNKPSPATAVLEGESHLEYDEQLPYHHRARERRASNGILSALWSGELWSPSRGAAATQNVGRSAALAEKSSGEGKGSATEGSNADVVDGVRRIAVVPSGTAERGGAGAALSAGGASLQKRNHKSWSGGSARSSGSNSRTNQKLQKFSSIEIHFEDFSKMVDVWQSAARFRQFEERTEVHQQHLESALATRYFLPDSTPLFVWQTVILIFSTITIFGALSVFTYQEKHVGQFLAVAAPMELFITVLFLADIVVNFHTIRVERDPDTLTMVMLDSPASIARSYLSSGQFFLDLLGTLPLRFAAYAIGDYNYTAVVLDPVTGAIPAGAGCVPSCDTIDEYRHCITVAKVLVTIRCVKYLSHLWSFEESRLVLMTQTYLTRFFTFARFLVIMSKLLVLIQCFATIYLSMHPRTDAEVTDGGGLVLARAYYLVLECFSSVGYGDIVPTSPGEEIYFCVLVCVAALVNGYVIGESVGFFQKSDIDSRRGERLLELVAMCDFFGVPEGLQQEVLAFYNHISKSDITSSSFSFDDLPAELRSGLILNTRLRLIKQLPWFDELHRSARLLLCDCLVKRTYCPEQYVIYSGEIGHEMFFLSHGYVDILGRNGMYLVTLRKGMYFGEMAIIDPDPQPRTADVKAITFCEMYVLGKDMFQEILSRYPRLRSAIGAIAESRRAQMSLQSSKAPPTTAAVAPAPPAASEVRLPMTIVSAPPVDATRSSAVAGAAADSGPPPPRPASAAPPGSYVANLASSGVFRQPSLEFPGGGSLLAGTAGSPPRLSVVGGGGGAGGSSAADAAEVESLLDQLQFELDSLLLDDGA